MKNNFPFTNYDFYAYLTSGGMLLAFLDYVFNDSKIISLKEWSFMQIVLSIASAYILGHLIAWASQVTIEMCIMRRLLTAPNQIQLGFSTPNLIERWLGLAVGRYYEPFSEPARHAIVARAAAALDLEAAELRDAEAVFQVAHNKATRTDPIRQRSDDFRNQYGLFRNITLVGIVATIILLWSAWFGSGSVQDGWIVIIAASLTIGAFVRFVKFYASFSAEVLRSLLSKE